MEKRPDQYGTNRQDILIVNTLTRLDMMFLYEKNNCIFITDNLNSK